MNDFTTRWQTLLPASYAHFARLAAAAQELYLPQDLLGAALLWPIRPAIQESDAEAIDAVWAICGPGARPVFQAMLDWGHDPLTSARDLAVRAQTDLALADALDQLSRYFQASAPFAEAVARVVVEQHGRGNIYDTARQIQATLANIGGSTTIQSLGLALHPGGLDSQPPHISFTVPPLPDNFVQRPAEYEQVCRLLLAASLGTPDWALGLTTMLKGGGGFGKTTLAQAICHDPWIEAAFPDGILWLTIGQTPRLLDLLNRCIQRFELGGPALADINLAADHLRRQLVRRRVLLVLDDVRQETDALPFLQDSPTCAHLITTHCQDLLLPLNTPPVAVNEMTTDQAAEMLTSGLSQRPVEMQPLRTLAARLGKWPLLLNLVAAQLKELVQLDGLPLAEALARVAKPLAEGGFIAFDRADEQQRSRAIGRSLNYSLERLGRWRDCYLALAVFPDDVDIPFSTLARWWQQTGGLDDSDAEDARDAMCRLSLFTRYDPDRQIVRLHDVIRHYLMGQHQDLAGLHAQFLTTYRPAASAPLPIWANLPQDEPYLWDHLAYHLIEAGLADELLATVKDLHYLAAKSYTRTPAAVEADLRAVQDHFSQEPLLSVLTRHFTHMAHLLQGCDNLADCQVTLYSRLYQDEDLASLSHALAETLRPPYVLPAQPLPDLPHPALVRTLTGHSAFVYDCGYNPDGTAIVSASMDGTLKVWDAHTGQERLTLAGHTDGVWGCAYSPDGRAIVSSSDDHTLKTWDALTGQEGLTLTGHRKRVSSCAYSPDGTAIVSGSADDTLKVWDAYTGQLRLTLAGYRLGVTDCAYSPDGRAIVSAFGDGTLKVWDTHTGQLRLTLAGHTNWALGCAYSPDGRAIVSASNDGTLKIWDTHTGQERLTLAGHTSGVNGCAYSPDGTAIASASSDHTLKIWDARTGEERLTLAGHSSSVTGCAYSPDGRAIVSASWDETLKIWDLSRLSQPDARIGPERVTLTGHNSSVTGCTYSPDGRTVVSASHDCTLKVWDARTGQEHLTLTGHKGWVWGCTYSPDGTAIVSTSSDNTLKVWDARTGQERLTLAGHAADVFGCGCSPDGTAIVSASADRTLKVWDIHTGQECLTLTGHTELVTGCAYSPDGRAIVSASKDGTLKVWDARTGQEHLILAGHIHGVEDCAYSPDGRAIVSASKDRTLKVWDARSGQERLTLTGHKDRVTRCAYSPDGTLIISTSWDKTLKVWDARSGRCQVTLCVEKVLSACAWSPDGERLVAVGAGGVYFLRFVKGTEG